MNVVRGRADARWLPSRHRYALFRLIASVRLRFAKPEPQDVVLAIDHDQSAFENYTIAIWVVLTLACYFSANPLMLIAAIPLAIVIFNAPVVILGLTLPNRNNIRLSSMIIMLLLIGAAAYFATAATWVRFAAWQFLALVVLNAIVAALLAVRRLILGLAILAPVALVLLWPYSKLAAIGILAFSHALLLYPILRPNSQWLGPVATRFETAARELWLTIDDGPTSDTHALLELFDRLGVKATFFVKGKLAQANPDAIREMIARGHSAANHSQTHPSSTFWCALPSHVRDEIGECNRTLETITGARPQWFRAPVGHKNPFVHPALAREGMRLIGWTARGFDAVLDDADEIARRIVARAMPGAIVVLHQGRAHSLRVIERVIVALQERGYAFVIPDDAALRNTKR